MIARFAIFQNAASHLSPGSCIQSLTRTVDHLNPGVLRADPGYHKHALFRAQFGLRFPIFGFGFGVPVEMVSTPTENTVLIGYLTKITVLIAI